MAEKIVFFGDFSVADNESYCGLPWLTNKGDWVLVLEGSEVPIILREYLSYTATGKEAQKFQFIGPCYVQGCMDGEVMNLGLERTFTLV